MQIKCDKCSLAADSIMPETARDGDIEHTFFRCPECGAVYPISTTDEDLRKRITEYDRRRQLIRIRPMTEQFLRETERIKQARLWRVRQHLQAAREFDRQPEVCGLGLQAALGRCQLLRHEICPGMRSGDRLHDHDTFLPTFSSFAPIFSSCVPSW